MFYLFYLNKAVRAFIAIFLISIGWKTFGHPELFDRIILGMLVLLMLLPSVRSDINISAIILIFISERIIEELFYFTLSYNSQKLIIYSLAILVIYLMHYDKLVRYLVTPIVMLTVIAECYWYYSGYNAPAVQFYISMLLLNIFVRYLLMMRSPITNEVIKLSQQNHDIKIKKAEPMPIDWLLYTIVASNIIAISVMIFEYMLRHILNYNQLYFYNIYPSIIHLLTILTFTVILDHIIKHDYSLHA